MSLSELSDKVLKEMEKLEVENMMTDNEKAEIILENLDKAAATTKDNIQGQAKFIRAITHFEKILYTCDY